MNPVDKFMFQCRTRLCGWCNRTPAPTIRSSDTFQCRTRLCGWCNWEFRVGESCPEPVSMPHAALWVVQHEYKDEIPSKMIRFNAARGFVGGATSLSVTT